jgi:hypothetical protein
MAVGVDLLVLLTESKFATIPTSHKVLHVRVASVEIIVEHRCCIWPLSYRLRRPTIPPVWNSIGR